MTVKADEYLRDPNAEKKRSIAEIQYCPKCGWGMYLLPGQYWKCGNWVCRYMEPVGDARRN